MIDDEPRYGSVQTLPANCDRYFLCAGVLYGLQAADMLEHERVTTVAVNFSDVVTFCDEVLDVNCNARICIVGSESGYAGSYDMLYAGAKAALHMYVERKKLKWPGQQLVCIAPTIVENSGMTQRRTDLDGTLERGQARRRGKWLQAEEVARLAHYALYVDSGALCNTVVRLNGGNW
jgi:NAD(P)-dependent dehydrogenase (short-subunit alcohol dehydrogenase family)